MLMKACPKSTTLFHKKRLSGNKKPGNAACFISAFLILITVVSCSDTPTSSPLYGTYKQQIPDSLIGILNAGHDAVIKVNNDKTINYNTTINYKPKFNIDGVYTLDEKTNTLKIKWNSGKLPDIINIEKVKEDYIIKIGNSIYRKEK